MTTSYYVTRVVPCDQCKDGEVISWRKGKEIRLPCPLCMGSRKMFQRFYVEVPHDWTPPEAA